MRFWYTRPAVLRYFAVSGTMTLCSLALMMVFLRQGVPSGAASFVSSVIATIPCFFLQRRLTFESNGRMGLQAASFGLLYGVQRALAAVTAILLLDVLHASNLAGSLGTVGIVAVFGYAAQRLWVFRQTPEMARV